MALHNLVSDKGTYLFSIISSPYSNGQHKKMSFSFIGPKIYKNLNFLKIWIAALLDLKPRTYSRTSIIINNTYLLMNLFIDR